MQNVQEVMSSSVRLNNNQSMDKTVESSPTTVVTTSANNSPPGVVKKSRSVFHPKQLVWKQQQQQQQQQQQPKILNNTNNSNNNKSNSQITSSVQNDKQFQATVVAEKYLLLEQAEGSSLFRCVDVNTQEELVCKIVSKDSHALVSAHYRLDSNPRVSSLHEVIVGNRYLYLVYPKAHGDLHSYVRSRKRLRESEAKRLFKQIAETVQVCHRNGIVLRDLKLRKFVFGDAQRTELKLESLEDAVVLEEPEMDWLHDKRGCPAYVSPEILKAGAHYSGKAADMWSLGVILYTMLVGRYPFNDSEHASLFMKISRGHFVIPECLSSRAKCLIRSLLRREPSERITSEDILYHPWLAKEDREWSSRACDQLVPESSLYDY